MLTSDAYFVAVAAPHVCVNRSTMTGSTGVVMEGWGLDRTIGRWDIERRDVHGRRPQAATRCLSTAATAGRGEGGGAPPCHPRALHPGGEGRPGQRLKGEAIEPFSGDYWTGEQASKIGLVDGLCDLESVIRQHFGVEQLKDYTLPPNLFARMANSFGVLVRSQLAAEFSTAQPRFYRDGGDTLTALPRLP